MGFLSLNKKIRKEKLEEIKNENKTIILYEAPHKVLNTLKDLQKVVQERQVVLARELTKIHEQFIRGTINEILDKYKEPRGEHIIIIEGNNNVKEQFKNDFFRYMTINEHYTYYEEKGFSKNEIIKKIAKDRNVAKNDIYKLFI